MNIKELIKEALSYNEKAWVSDAVNMRPDDGSLPMGHDASSHVFKHGEDTLRFPLDVNAKDVPINTRVREHLENHGYRIPDSFAYMGGHSLDEKNKIVSIGKVLKKTDAHPDVLKAFVNDPYRAAMKHPMHVVITKNPEHVAGMSTDRGWTSCMDLRRGAMKDDIQHDMLHGTHVAYLVHEHDEHVKEPVARIAIKPFQSEDGHVILRPEHKTYGAPNTAFEENVHHFCNTHFPSKANTTYHLAPDLYDDSERHTIKDLGDPKEFIDKGKEIHSRNVNDLMMSKGHRKAIFDNYSKLTNTERRYVASPYQEFNLNDRELATIAEHHDTNEYAIHPKAAFHKSVPLSRQVEYMHGERKTQVSGAQHINLQPEVQNAFMEAKLSGQHTRVSGMRIHKDASKELAKRLIDKNGPESHEFHNLTADEVSEINPAYRHTLPHSTVNDYLKTKQTYGDAALSQVRSPEIAKHILENTPRKYYEVSAEHIENMPSMIQNQHSSLAGNHVQKLFDYSKLKDQESKGFYRQKYMQHAEAGKYSKRHLNQAFDIAEKEGDHEAMEKYNQHLKREYPRTEQDDASYQNRILKAKQS